jgi:hypothetical protein
MTWRVFAPMALQLHGWFAFFPTQFHLSSASASNRCNITLVGPDGSRTCTCSGQAAKRSTRGDHSTVRELIVMLSFVGLLYIICTSTVTDRSRMTARLKIMGGFGQSTKNVC